MMDFATDYFLYVFISSFAVIQISATKSNLSQILINKNRFLTIISSFIIIISSTIFFIYSENRIINDFEGGLDANQQFLIFAFACLSSFLMTAIITSLYRKSDHISQNTESFNGLKILSKYSFFKLQLLKWNRYKKSI